MHHHNCGQPDQPTAQDVGKADEGNAGVCRAQGNPHQNHEDAIAKQLDAATTRVAEFRVRLNASLEEIRYAQRRAEADLDHARRFAIEGMAKSLLPFKDALEAALAIDTTDVPALQAGLELARKQLIAVLDRST